MQIGLLGLGPINLAGLGVPHGLGTLSAFADQIKRIEGYLPPGTPGYPNGSLAYQNNNPGNIRYTSYYASNFGATPGVSGYAKFPSYEAGYAALERQITLDAGRGLTILGMMSKYAPASDGNDPVAYAEAIASSLGVPVDTPVSQVIWDQTPASGFMPPELLPDRGDRQVSEAGFGGMGLILGVLVVVLVVDLMKT